jgi:molybdopterin converting factor small subunit
MSVMVQLTYDMSKEIGQDRLELQGAQSVKDVVRMTRERFAEGGAKFDLLSRVTAVSINGVLINFRKGMKTKVADGDTIAFVKAAAGG